MYCFVRRLLWLQRRAHLCDTVAVVAENVAVAAAPFIVLWKLRCGCSNGAGLVKVLLCWLIMMLWLQRRALRCENVAVAAAPIATL